MVITLDQQEENVEKIISRVAQCMRDADVLLVAAGAGMGVDAGIPDYYGGIHRAHPRLAEIGLSIYDLSNHVLFEHNPKLAWGHWITRQREYRNISPHAGYRLLYTWSQCNKRCVRIVTTNLDRHFLRTGFPSENIFEMHGSMYDAQCMRGCGIKPWELDTVNMPAVDLKTMELLGQPPQCLQCGGSTRVCTQLAVDGHWDARHVEEARLRHETFFRALSPERALTVLEIGCGTVMAKVRSEAERIVAEHRIGGSHTVHVRINSYEANIDSHEDNISLPLGALEALRRIFQLSLNNADR